MAERCEQCLFGRDRIVGRERAASLIRRTVRSWETGNRSHFSCHLGTMVGRDVACRGWMDAVVRRDPLLGQLEAVGVISRVSADELGEVTR